MDLFSGQLSTVSVSVIETVLRPLAEIQPVQACRFPLEEER